MAGRYFGTDGIRGVFGGEVINPEFVLKLGQATGKILKDLYAGKAKVLIGKDTRISGYLLESCLEAGLTSSGVDVLMLGPIPTPAVAYLTRTFKAQAGIVISASHNPYYDNGIKFFSMEGSKLSDQVEKQIEQLLTKEPQLVPALELGKVKRLNDARGRYIEFCKGTLGLNYSLKGFKIVVDCANGATYRIAPNVFEELGAEVLPIGVAPDGFNINQGCGSTNVKYLAETVLKEGADLGIAFDGDGDRIILVDYLGREVGGDQILYVLAKFYHQIGILKGGVVGTLASSLGLEHSLKRLGIEFVRANVGDRYVKEALLKQKWFLGGENSGHIVHLGLTTTGDGIVAALQVLRVMKEEEKNLTELTKTIIQYPAVSRDIKTNNGPVIVKNVKFQSVLAEIEQSLQQQAAGRILVRCSGTEPVLRLLLEGNVNDLDDRMQALVEVIESLDTSY